MDVQLASGFANTSLMANMSLINTSALCVYYLRSYLAHNWPKVN